MSILPSRGGAAGSSSGSIRETCSLLFSPREKNQASAITTIRRLSRRLELDFAMGCTRGDLRVITCQIRGSLWRGNPEPSSGTGRRRCRDLTAGTLTVWPRVKRKSRPQTVRSGPAVKTVVGTHNPKVAGSNPAPATQAKPQALDNQGLRLLLLVHPHQPRFPPQAAATPSRHKPSLAPDPYRFSRRSFFFLRLRYSIPP